MPKEKTIKIWNGRGLGGFDHFFVAAFTKRQAAELMCRASRLRWPTIGSPSKLDIDRMVRELNDFYSADCWGTQMAGITPEVGVWATTSHCDNNPKKVI